MATQEQIYAMVQQILGEGGDNAFLDDYDLYAQPWLGPTEDKTPGTLESQNAYLTATGKASSRAMDPSFILGLGASAGGFSPDAFNPVTTYKPIKADGQMMAKRWLTGGDPLQRQIAERAAQGYGAGTIEAEILTMLKDPNSKAGAEIRKSIPPQFSVDPISGQQVQSDQPDYTFLRDQIGTLTTALASDSGQWDGVTVDETGAPAIASQEDSYATEALKRGGFSNTPYDTYDPYAFAPDGVTRESDQGVMAGSRTANEAQRGASQNLRSQEQMLKTLLSGIDMQRSGKTDSMFVPPPKPQIAPTAGQAGGAAAAPASSLLPSGFVPQDQAVDLRADRSTPQTTNAPSTTNAPAPAPQRNSGGMGRSSGVVYDLADADRRIRQGEAQVAKGRRGVMSATKDARHAANDRTQAIVAAKQRQRMVEELLAAGHGPFMDQMRARQANVWAG